jgi:hypothetical protein
MTAPYATKAFSGSLAPLHVIVIGVRLRDALVATQRGEMPVLDAIGGYEAGICDYGFKAVSNSLQAMQQMTAQGPIAMALSRTAFRVISRLLPIKRRMAREMGEE